MTDANPTFKIEITPTDGGYKSIQSLIWDNIPSFAIITGRNGSGKTQLLEILAYHLTGTTPPQNKLGVSVDVSGIKIDVDEVGFVPSAGRFSGAGGASIASMQNSRHTMYQQIHQLGSYSHDPAQMTRVRRIQKRVGGRNWGAETNQGATSLDDDEFLALLVDVDVTSHLATIFVDHRVKLVEALERGTPNVGKDGKSLGPAPWDVVNESLLVAGFPYEVVKPTEVGLLEHYSLLLRDINSKIEIPPGDLSPGERVILQLTLWLR